MALTWNDRKIGTLDDLNVDGRPVFLRVDLNVPLSGDRVADDTRITAILPTVRALLERKARVVLASHLGRPKGKPDPKYSLIPVGARLAELLDCDVIVPDDCVGAGVRRVLSDQRADKVVLLENLRFHKEEEANDPGFAEALKGLTEVFVNDAFGALHRAHASTAALPELYEERAAGRLVAEELRFLTPLLKSPERPYAVVLGGAKVSDKIRVIGNLIRRIDHLLLGGAMVFTFLKAAGRKVGLSLVEDDRLEHARRILEQAEARGVRVHLPCDFVLGRSAKDPGEPRLMDGTDIPDEWAGLDVGPKTVEEFSRVLCQARTVFWNGPMGLFEKEPFDAGTVGLARALASTNAVSVIGGGDSAAAVKRAGVGDKMTHISTGGGATLEFLEGVPLPGLVSLSV